MVRQTWVSSSGSGQGDATVFFASTNQGCESARTHQRGARVNGLAAFAAREGVVLPVRHKRNRSSTMTQEELLNALKTDSSE